MSLHPVVRAQPLHLPLLDLLLILPLLKLETLVPAALRHMLKLARSSCVTAKSGGPRAFVGAVVVRHESSSSERA